MKKLLITALPPLLGILISTQGGIVVNEVHAEKFDPTDSYSYERVGHLKTNNRLDTLNRNQDVLNISKRQQAEDIINGLNLKAEDKQKYIDMLSTSVEESSMSEVVEVALMNSESNQLMEVAKEARGEDDSYTDLAEVSYGIISVPSSSDDWQPLSSTTTVGEGAE